MNKFIKKVQVKLIQLFPKIVDDKKYVEIIYEYIFNKKLDLSNPLTYNEKLQWLKLYDRNPKYAKLVDKYEVKSYVEERIGSSCLIPTLGVWKSFEDIDFSFLPNQFVLKCTHDSGSVIICTDKSSFDLDEAKHKLTRALKRNYFYQSREFPYKNVTPRIIAEPYMENLNTTQLLDYKIFCFGGKAEYLFIASDRFKTGPTYFDYFDREFNRLNLRQSYHPNSNYKFDKPECFDSMITMAEKLSQELPQARIDFYVINNKVYFGEITFFHHGGFAPFIPEEYDALWGGKINLPERQK